MPGRAKLSKITEGCTILTVPTGNRDKGPGTRAGVFYNPAMRTNRDITVLFGRAVAKPGWSYLDALGGTGAKGIRLAKESGKDLEVQVNDLDRDSYSAIKKNIALNKLENVAASNLEYNVLLSGRGFDWIDIDPFGSPVKFLDLAVRHASRNGIISITATDTAPLCGTKPDTCLRRYQAMPLNDNACHEFGLRILVGNAVRRAAVFDYGLEPVMAYYHGHYFRAYFRKRKGVQVANAGLGQLEYIRWDDKSGYSIHETRPEGTFAGPLWTGPLWEPAAVKRILKACDETFHRDTRAILESLLSELPHPPYHYHIDDMARRTGTRPLKTDDLVMALRAAGFRASGVHYSRKGVKTDAGLSAIGEIFNKASQ